MTIEHVVIVGLGGVGTHLAGPLCRYLAVKAPTCLVTLIDGRSFKPSNAERQDFTEMGHKAEVTARRLATAHPRLKIEFKNKYVTEDNVYVYVREGSHVLCCPDNHPTRLLLSRHCATLENATLISGGNDYHDGNVQVYARRDGKDATPPLTHLHPEIAHPTDRHPAEMSCEELAATSTPQLIFANVKVATEMAGAFWTITEHGLGEYSELYFDLKTGAQRAIKREW